MENDTEVEKRMHVCFQSVCVNKRAYVSGLETAVCMYFYKFVEHDPQPVCRSCCYECK